MQIPNKMTLQLFVAWLRESLQCELAMAEIPAELKALLLPQVYHNSGKK